MRFTNEWWTINRWWQILQEFDWRGSKLCPDLSVVHLWGRRWVHEFWATFFLSRLIGRLGPLRYCTPVASRSVHTGGFSLLLGFLGLALFCISISDLWYARARLQEGRDRVFWRRLWPLRSRSVLTRWYLELLALELRIEGLPESWCQREELGWQHFCEQKFIQL